MNQKWADAYRMGKERSGGRNTFEKFLIHVIKIYVKTLQVIDCQSAKVHLAFTNVPACMHPRQSLIHLGVLIRLVAGAMFLFIDSDSDWFAECGWPDWAIRLSSKQRRQMEWRLFKKINKKRVCPTLPFFELAMTFNEKNLFQSTIEHSYCKYVNTA